MKRETSKKKVNECQKFTIDDVHQILKERLERNTMIPAQVEKASPKEKSSVVKNAKAVASQPISMKSSSEKRKSASIMDILGFDMLGSKKDSIQYNRADVPKQWIKYFDQLMCMREELERRLLSSLQRDGLCSENNSSAEKSSLAAPVGPIPQEINLDLALSFTSTEQELLNEVNEALKRIQMGNYGICEQTGEKIDKKRLDAFPFARFSINGQRKFEQLQKERQASFQPTSLFVIGDEEFSPEGDADEEMRGV